MYDRSCIVDVYESKTSAIASKSPTPILVLPPRQQAMPHPHPLNCIQALNPRDQLQETFLRRASRRHFL